MQICSPLEGESLSELPEIITQLFKYTESHRNIISYVFHPRHNEFLTDEPPICNSSPFMSIRDIIQQGMDSGEIKKHNIWVASAAIYGGPIRMIHLRLDNVIEQPLPELLDDIIDSVWQGMLGEKAEMTSDNKLSIVKN